MKAGFRVMAVVSVVALLGCTGLIETVQENTQSVDRGSFRRSIALLPDSARLEWTRLLQFISFVDKALSRKIECLSAIDDAGEIDSLVQALYRRMDFEYNPESPDTNEWLGEMDKRMAHCDENYAGVGVLGRFWDMRAEAVILRGIPSVERVEDDGVVTVWTQEWDSDFLTLEYRGRLGDNHPSKFMNRSSMEVIRRLYSIRRPIYANMPRGERLKMGVQVVTFPGDNGTEQLYSISGVDISSLRSRGSDDVSFHVEMTIYAGEAEPQEIARCVSPSLRIPVELTARDDMIYPVHLGCSVAAGSYNCVVSVFQDSSENRGVYCVAAEIPSASASTGWSDLLLTVPNSTTSHWNFIERNGRTLVGNVSRVFEKGDTLFPYVEISRARQFQGDSISVAAVLHRVPIIVGSPASGVVRGGIIVYSGSYSVGDDGLLSFRHPIIIDSHVKGGDYLLAVTAKAPGQQAYGLAFTQIKIK